MPQNRPHELERLQQRIRTLHISNAVAQAAELNQVTFEPGTGEQQGHYTITGSTAFSRDTLRALGLEEGKHYSIVRREGATRFTMWQETFEAMLQPPPQHAAHPRNAQRADGGHTGNVPQRNPGTQAAQRQDHHQERNRMVTLALSQRTEGCMGPGRFGEDEPCYVLNAQYTPQGTTVTLFDGTTGIVPVNCYRVSTTMNFSRKHFHEKLGLSGGERLAQLTNDRFHYFKDSNQAVYIKADKLERELGVTIPQRQLDS